MQTTPSYQKPRSEKYRPEIIRLPRLTIWRRVFRRLVIGLLRILMAICTRSHVYGLENIPQHGAALSVSNHLGDADALMGIAFSKRPVDIIAKAELYDIPLFGRLLDAFGVIWVHRGRPDKRALRVALESLKKGRLVGIAPEGRESLTGALEEGTGGAAFIAIKADVPILPVTFTGTENSRVFGNLKRLRRTEVSMTIGKLFTLQPAGNTKDSVQAGTGQIMKTLAAQLPEEYRGVYQLKEDIRE